MKKPQSICFCKKDNTFGEYKNTVEMITPFKFDLGGGKRTHACIDCCIASEIAYLWYNGIETLNSCCGHGLLGASVFVKKKSVSKMLELGYKLSTEKSANPDVHFVIDINSNIAGKEICVCAAIRWNNKVWKGHRHGDAMHAMREELSFTMNRKEMLGKNLFEDQGFITSKNRYVSREEGRILQDAAGIKSADKNGYRNNTLFSEDLY